MNRLSGRPGEFRGGRQCGSGRSRPRAPSQHLPHSESQGLPHQIARGRDDQAEPRGESPARRAAVNAAEKPRPQRDRCHPRRHPRRSLLPSGERRPRVDPGKEHAGRCDVAATQHRQRPGQEGEDNETQGTGNDVAHEDWAIEAARSLLGPARGVGAAHTCHCAGGEPAVHPQAGGAQHSSHPDCCQGGCCSRGLLPVV